MQRIPTERILRLWEQGLELHPIERALAILQAALPEMAQQELGQLTLGQRNRFLMAIREAHFGKQLQCLTNCLNCNDILEFNLDITQLYQNTPDVVAEQDIIVGDYTLKFRPLNSYDLAAAAKQTESEKAQQVLVQRCLLEVKDYAGNWDELPTTVINALATQIKALDPLAETLLPLNCPVCGERSEVLFDIATFLWDELIADLKQSLHDVHALACVYGWSEKDILAMTVSHRQFYLEQIRV